MTQIDLSSWGLILNPCIYITTSEAGRQEPLQAKPVELLSSWDYI